MSNTVTDFIARHSLGFRCERRCARPDTVNSWADGLRHYFYQLRTLQSDAVVSGWYSQGLGIKEEPTLAELLECLASDASAYENAEDMLDFAAEFGYVLDTKEQREQLREAYKACQKIFVQLGALLGVEGRDELLAMDFSEI